MPTRQQVLQMISDLRGATTHQDKLKVAKEIQKRHPEIGRKLKTCIEVERAKELAPNKQEKRRAQ